MTTKRHRKAVMQADETSVASLLGTGDTERQIALTRNLIDIAIKQEVYFGVLFRPQTGEFRVIHSDNARFQDLKAALDAGEQYLVENRVRAQMEQANAESNTQPTPNSGPPNAGEVGGAGSDGRNSTAGGDPDSGVP